MPNPTRVGCDAEWLCRRRELVAARAMRQVGQCEMHFQSRAVGLGWKCDIDRPLLRKNAGIDGLAVLSRSRPDAAAIRDLERQLGVQEVVLRTDPIGLEPFEQFLYMLERADCGEVGGTDGDGGAGQGRLLGGLRTGSGIRSDEAWANHHLDILAAS